MAFTHPYLAAQDFICFAHRGGGAEQPESSARAFAAAQALGYRYIEIDVQATADGRLIVFHDDTLERTTTGTGIISTLPYEVVREALIDGTELILTLEQVLEDFPDICFNIDIKTEQALQPTLDLMGKMKCFERICLASFSDNRLAKVRHHLGPDVCTSAGPKSVFALKLGSWGLPMSASPVHCAQVPVSEYGVTIVTRGFISHCNTLGIAVHAWTIDDEDDMRRLIRLGVNGLITDRPSLLKQVAMEEGVWAG